MSVAAIRSPRLITEPILQEYWSGASRGRAYLPALRTLADEFRLPVVFDRRSRPGFRHAIGGYSENLWRGPDFVTYGKAVANGFPLASCSAASASTWTNIIPTRTRAGARWFSGTYNGHPVAVAAANFARSNICSPTELKSTGTWTPLGDQIGEGTAGISAGAWCDSIDRGRQGLAFSYYFPVPRFPPTFSRHHRAFTTSSEM